MRLAPVLAAAISLQPEGHPLPSGAQPMDESSEGC
jgi:hypothetical protein